MTEEELRKIEKKYLSDVSIGVDQYQELYNKGLQFIRSEPQPRELLLSILDEYMQRLEEIPAVDLSVTNLRALDSETREKVKSLILFGTQAVLIRDNAKKRENLRQANANYRDLLSVVTHEFKNSLTSIYGYNRIIKKRISEGRNSNLDEISENIDRLTKNLFGLVETLFSMSLIEQGKLKVDRKIFDVVHDALNPVLEELKFRMKQQKLSLKLIASSSKNIYYGDERFFQLVFRNLIQNAIQYGKSDSEITVEIERKKKHLEIIVFNYGSGLEENKLDRIFDKFSRFHTSRDRANVGIGLFAVKNIIELHNGTIEAQSRHHEWMRFIIKLPINF